MASALCVLHPQLTSNSGTWLHQTSWEKVFFKFVDVLAEHVWVRLWKVLPAEELCQNCPLLSTTDSIKEVDVVTMTSLLV